MPLRTCSDGGPSGSLKDRRVRDGAKSALSRDRRSDDAATADKWRRWRGGDGGAGGGQMATVGVGWSSGDCGGRVVKWRRRSPSGDGIRQVAKACVKWRRPRSGDGREVFVSCASWENIARQRPHHSMKMALPPSEQHCRVKQNALHEAEAGWPVDLSRMAPD